MDKRLRPDLAVIAEAIPSGARVLDIGCGDGRLMAELTLSSDVDARGLEILPDLVEQCVGKGLSVVQGDADRDLTDYPDNTFDYAVLSQTLQTAERPDKILEELLRVGRQAFVSFPNFAHWRTRAALMFIGRMPVTRALPVSWYETQNIHHVTIDDFRHLVAKMGAKIDQAWFFTDGKEISEFAANWRAEFAVFRLSR